MNNEQIKNRALQLLNFKYWVPFVCVLFSFVVFSALELFTFVFILVILEELEK
jgi:hypothetical protein